MCYRNGKHPALHWFFFILVAVGCGTPAAKLKDAGQADAQGADGAQADAVGMDQMRIDQGGRPDAQMTPDIIAADRAESRDAQSVDAAVLPDAAADDLWQPDRSAPDHLGVCEDPDGDLYGEGAGCLGPDCRPNDITIHPGAVETCDDRDNDCNSYIDDVEGCKPRLWVYILAGQSNMVGLGRNPQLPAAQRGNVPNLHIFYDDSVHPNPNTLRWMPLGPGFGVTENHFGPELSFGRQLHAQWPERQIALIKVAEGATDLQEHWAATSGRLYQVLLGHVRTQMSDLRGDWRPQIVGMLWMQGESDSAGSAADNYKSNLTNFFNTLRADLELPLMPVVAGLINPAGGWVEPETIRNATRDVASELGEIDVVETNDLSMHADDVAHYDSASNLTLGSRFAAATVAMVETQWSFAADFSDIQGEQGWSYHYLENSTSEPLRWGLITNRWINYGTDLVIDEGSMHPGSSQSAELRWWVPAQGRYQVSYSASLATATGGDGVVVEVQRSGEILQPATTLTGAAQMQGGFSADMLQGESLVFYTSAGAANNSDNDNTSWTIQIEQLATY